MSKFDIKKTLLEIFTSRQEDLEAEMKTAILNSNEHYYIAELYSVMSLGKYSKTIIEPYLRGLVASSRGLGGKGSEQLISLLYPGRFQQYLFPIPSIPIMNKRQAEDNEEEKKKKLLPIP